MTKINKYSIMANPEFINKLIESLTEFKKEMYKPQLARYIQVKFLELNKDMHIYLKFDKFYEYDEQGRLKPEYEKKS